MRIKIDTKSKPKIESHDQSEVDESKLLASEDDAAIIPLLKNTILDKLSRFTKVDGLTASWKIGKKKAGHHSAYISGERDSIKKVFDIFKKIPGIGMDHPKENAKGKIVKRSLDINNLNIENGRNSETREGLIIIELIKVEEPISEREYLKQFSNALSKTIETAHKAPEIIVIHKYWFRDKHGIRYAIGMNHFTLDIFLQTLCKEGFEFTADIAFDPAKEDKTARQREKLRMHIPSLFMKNVYEASGYEPLIDLTDCPHPAYESNMQFIEALKKSLNKFLLSNKIRCEIKCHNIMMFICTDTKKEAEHILELLKKNRFVSACVVGGNKKTDHISSRIFKHSFMKEAITVFLKDNKQDNRDYVFISGIEIYERLILGMNLRSPRLATNSPFPDEDEIESSADSNVSGRSSISP